MATRPTRRDPARLRAVGAMLAARRASLGITQEQLAAAAGVSPRTIKSAESGDHAITPVKRAGVERALLLVEASLTASYRTGRDLDVLKPETAHRLPSPTEVIAQADDLPDADQRAMYELAQAHHAELVAQIAARRAALDAERARARAATIRALRESTS